MAAVRHHDEVEVFIRLDERVGHQHRVRGRHVAVHRAVRDEQLALEIVCQQVVCLIVVVRGSVWVHFQQSLPLLSPIVLVVAVVVVARLRHRNVVEVWIAHDGVRRGVTPAGVTVDADVLGIDPGMTRAELADAGHLIRQSVVSHVAIVRIVEPLGATRRPHRVEFDDNEAEFRDRLKVTVRRPEAAASHAAALRPWVQVVDHWIRAVFVEVHRTKEKAVQVRHSVSGFYSEGHGRLPSGVEQPRDVRFLDRYERASAPVPEHGHGWNRRRRVAVDHVRSVR